jgi:hypothetical protein
MRVTSHFSTLPLEQVSLNENSEAQGIHDLQLSDATTFSFYCSPAIFGNQALP